MIGIQPNILWNWGYANRSCVVSPYLRFCIWVTIKLATGNIYSDTKANINACKNQKNHWLVLKKLPKGCLSGWNSIQANIELSNVISNDAMTEKINTMNTLWFFFPMQLFTQGQWWSYTSTHLQHITQWFDRFVLRTSHSGQMNIGWSSSSIF